MLDIIRNIFRKYPAHMIIAETRQGTPRIVIDKGTRIREKDGSEAYLLKKAKVKVPKEMFLPKSRTSPKSPSEIERREIVTG